MSSKILDPLLTILTIFITLVILVLLIAYYINYQVMKLPQNTPKRYNLRKQSNFKAKIVVVCVGDSITHGRISSDYVRILEERMSSEFEFVNAGINSNLAWNVLDRLEDIIDCSPNFITILIGTNDANAVLSPKNVKDYVKRMKLPQDPELDWFKSSLEKMIIRLKKETNAQLAILTLPTIGESPESNIFEHTHKYSLIIQEIAQNLDIECLPLQEVMINYLMENPADPKFIYENGMRLMVWSAIQRYFFLRSWDTISKKAGFKLHLDYLHLNTTGAAMIANLIEEFIEKNT
ncbi:MAG: SGNH/GDSL hydrolase family protein [Candidatus Hodarchaeales archaeon]